MSLHFIEGTWEEIESHKAELIGHHLRVIITPKSTERRNPATPAEVTAPEKVLRARGTLAGVLSSEDYFREKREETIREDRSLG